VAGRGISSAVVSLVVLMIVLGVVFIAGFLNKSQVSKTPTICYPLGKRVVSVTITTTKTVEGVVKKWTEVFISTESLGPELSPPTTFDGPRNLTQKGDATLEAILSSRTLKPCDVLWIKVKLKGPPDFLWGSTRLKVLKADGTIVYEVILKEHKPLWSNATIQNERTFITGWRAGPPGYPYDVPYLSDVTPGRYLLVLERGSGEGVLRVEVPFEVVG